MDVNKLLGAFANAKPNISTSPHGCIHDDPLSTVAEAPAIVGNHLMNEQRFIVDRDITEA